MRIWIEFENIFYYHICILTMSHCGIINCLDGCVEFNNRYVQIISHLVSKIIWKSKFLSHLVLSDQLLFNVGQWRVICDSMWYDTFSENQSLSSYNISCSSKSRGLTLLIKTNNMLSIFLSFSVSLSTVYTCV